MESFEQPISFRTKPAKVKIGSKEKIIIVSDIPYGKKKELFSLLNRIWFEQETAPVAADLLREEAALRMAPATSIVEMMQKIQEDISKIYGAQTDRIVELLKLMTSDQITDEDVEDMEGDEIYSLAVWLINRNLESRKNLNASLSSILTPTVSSSQK